MKKWKKKTSNGKTNPQIVEEKYAVTENCRLQICVCLNLLIGTIIIKICNEY